MDQEITKPGHVENLAIYFWKTLRSLLIEESIFNAVE